MMVLIGQYYVSFSELVTSIRQVPALLLLLPLIIFVYIIIHEFIHGIFMKMYSGVKPQYGFSGSFIYAKSEAYFSKVSYIVLTLAPFILIGVLTIIAGFIISISAIWFVILVGIINLYASRGDLQAVYLLKDIPTNYLIKDLGDSLDIYKITE